MMYVTCARCVGLSSQIFLVSKRQAGESWREKGEGEREIEREGEREREREREGKVFTRVSSGRHPLAEEGAS